MSNPNVELPRLTKCPLCGQPNLLAGRGVQVHMIKRHPERKKQKKSG